MSERGCFNRAYVGNESVKINLDVSDEAALNKVKPTLPMLPSDLRTRRSFSGLLISSGESETVAVAKGVHEDTFNCIETVVDHALVWPCQCHRNRELTIGRL